MTSPFPTDCQDHALSATFYADTAKQRDVMIAGNTPLARDTYRLRLASPDLGSMIKPGQFVMIRLKGTDNPLLARPFALYDTWCDDSGMPIGFDIGYLVVGKMTQKLKTLRTGDMVEVWGPLGNGFQPRKAEHLIMVAGGIGQTPFLALGREALGGRRYGRNSREVSSVDRVTLCYGVRSKAFAAGLDDFRSAGVTVRLSTDDGSEGHHGYVTDLLKEVLSIESQQSRIVCCGPEPMMAAVANIAREHEVPCEVSLETPMACGIGICFSCVTKVRQEEFAEGEPEWDYKRTCVDGPVFDAKKIVF
ncbi:MAG: dihydroorotate dehydrogenase electron transfer subunit [Lacipirellulaceae bacterium]